MQRQWVVSSREVNWAVFRKIYSASRVENGLSQRQGGKQEDQLGYYCIAEPKANGDQNLRNGSRDGQTDKYKAHFRCKVALTYRWVGPESFTRASGIRHSFHFKVQLLHRCWCPSSISWGGETFCGKDQCLDMRNSRHLSDMQVERPVSR